MKRHGRMNLKSILLRETRRSENTTYYDSNYLMFFKETVKRPAYRKKKGGGMNTASTEYCKAVKILCNITMMGYVSLYICPNPLNTQHPESTMVWTSEEGWLWCISVAPSLVRYVPSGGQGEAWETFVPSCQSLLQTQTVLKKPVKHLVSKETHQKLRFLNPQINNFQFSLYQLLHSCRKKIYSRINTFIHFSLNNSWFHYSPVSNFSS